VVVLRRSSSSSASEHESIHLLDSDNGSGDLGVESRKPGPHAFGAIKVPDSSGSVYEVHGDFSQSVPIRLPENIPLTAPAAAVGYASIDDCLMGQPGLLTVWHVFGFPYPAMSSRFIRWWIPPN
jgi:hypothetical protein